MKQLLIIAAIAFSFTACDKAESERKAAADSAADAEHKQADATREKAEAQAHATKAAGEEAAKQQDQKADAIKKAP